MELKKRVHESLKNKKIYKLLPPSMLANYFNYTKQKFISNTDTFYYSIKIVNDLNEDVECRDFLNYLDVCRQAVGFEPFLLELEDLQFQMRGIGFSVYKYDLHMEDRYSVFFANKIPNKETPEIFVQIRSAWLWMCGEEYCIKQSLMEIEKLLNSFEIKVLKIKENRIDYAFHTNYIQDMSSFFPESEIGRMQVSHFKRWHKEGKIDLEDNVLCDYFTLGRRKSNNIFFRVYNKTQEVIEMQYKQFFLMYWQEKGLISFFDFWVCEEAFKHKSYNYLDRARIEFYLNFVCGLGLDPEGKEEIESILKDKKTTPQEIKKLADSLVPQVMLVCNIEFQTKSKFWNSLNESIETMPEVTADEKIKRVMKIVYNKDSFTDFLTEEVIRFVDLKSPKRKKDKPNAIWWDLLRKSTKADLKSNKLYRTYQKEVSKETVKRSILSALGTLSLYMEEEEQTNLYQNLDNFLEYVNENDLERYLRLKKKKAPAIKSRLSHHRTEG